MVILPGDVCDVGDHVDVVHARRPRGVWQDGVPVRKVEHGRFVASIGKVAGHLGVLAFVQLAWRGVTLGPAW